MTEPGGESQFDIVISGASFAGLALARALGASLPGLRIALVDPAPSTPVPAPDSRAVTISASSKRMLEALGVWPDVAGEAEPVTRIEITDSSLDAGIRPVVLSYDNQIDGEAGAWVIPNVPLLLALRTAAVQTAGVTAFWKAAARAFASDATAAQVSLEDGRTLSAPLAVAADGRRSALRDAAGVKCVRWTDEQTGIVVTIAHERPHHGAAVQHFLPGGPFALLPLPGNRCCVTWSESTEEARRVLALDDAAFAAEVERRAGGKLGAIRLDGPRQSWPLEHCLARAYSARRFALMGDAAHAVHPIAGQGANLALRDAAALAETLADAARVGLDLGSATALDRYARWRRFDATAAAFGFAGLNRLFSNDSHIARAARGMGLKLVDGLPGIKSFFVREAAGLTGDLPRLLKGEAA